MGSQKLESSTSFYIKNGSKIGLIAIVYIFFSATILKIIEGWSWLDSTYFVVVTMATVGYGDVSPKTPAGKLFTIFFIIFGIAIFSAVITNISKRAHERSLARRQK